MEIEELRSKMETWPVQWRWEGTSGHPRRMVDIFVRTFEAHGFTIEVAELQGGNGPLKNVTEFEGVLTGLSSQSKAGAARKKWAAGIVGIALLPLVIGYFVLKYTFHERKYEVGLEWRGEAYSTTARADQGGFSAERAGILSDVRITLRGAVFELGKLIKDVSDIQPKLNTIQATLLDTLPTLSAPSSVSSARSTLGSEPPLLELEHGVDGGIDSPAIDEPPQPPVLRGGN